MGLGDFVPGSHPVQGKDELRETLGRGRGGERVRGLVWGALPRISSGRVDVGIERELGKCSCCHSIHLKTKWACPAVNTYKVSPESKKREGMNETPQSQSQAGMAFLRRLSGHLPQGIRFFRKP